MFEFFGDGEREREREKEEYERKYLHLYLIYSRYVLAMMEGGDEDRHCLDMIHADIKLVLKHPSPLITHASQGLFPLFCSLGAHVVEDP